MKTNFLKENEVRQEVKNLIKGAYYRLGYETNGQQLVRAKNEGAVIRKQTIVVARFGIEYQNMAVNKDKQTGAMLNGAKYEKGEYTYIVEQANGNKQLVAYVNKVVETKWYFNGVEVEKQWLIDNKYISNSKPHISNGVNRIQVPLLRIFEIGKIEV